MLGCQIYQWDSSGTVGLPTYWFGSLLTRKGRLKVQRGGSYYVGNLTVNFDRFWLSHVREGDWRGGKSVARKARLPPRYGDWAAKALGGDLLGRETCVGDWGLPVLPMKTLII